MGRLDVKQSEGSMSDISIVCPHCAAPDLSPGWAGTRAGRFCRSCCQYENLPNTARPIGPLVLRDYVTMRAEQIREHAGMSWEVSCRIAERERDAGDFHADPRAF
jgi:hypothetical protein